MLLHCDLLLTIEVTSFAHRECVECDDPGYAERTQESPECRAKISLCEGQSRPFLPPFSFSSRCRRRRRLLHGGLSVSGLQRCRIDSEQSKKSSLQADEEVPDGWDAVEQHHHASEDDVRV